MCTSIWILILITKIDQKVAYLDQIIKYLEQVLRGVNNRTFLIKNAIEWEKIY